jgi:hypothetical protein
MRSGSRHTYQVDTIHPEQERLGAVCERCAAALLAELGVRVNGKGANCELGTRSRWSGCDISSRGRTCEPLAVPPYG